ncbi:MAG: phosphoenolpyruvate--protein phosphotransferase [Tissierellia bacterium]|nr:phosphoenolpyruvate--protein phosphotransferase [Tissierellia bacterium]
MQNKYKGIIASNGIAMGPIFMYTKQKIEVSNEKISENDVIKEQEKVKDAINSYSNEIENRVKTTPEEEAIANAHTELLSDPYFEETILNKIESELKNSQLALDETVKEMVMTMEALDDEYLKERAADYKDIGEQVMYKLMGVKANNLSRLTKEVIIISKELTPSDTSTMDKKNVLGFATDLGGKTSHTSIIAQTLDIPAVVGMNDITKHAKDGDFAIIDGDQGEIILNPDDELKKEYINKIDKINAEKQRLLEMKDKKAITKDGKHCEVAANIGNLNDLDIAIEAGCDGVGLFRTEFLYMENSHFPTEDEQYEVYKKACEKLEGKPIIIRTLDIGGDKGLDYYEFPKEENPFLGYRAIRLCLDKIEVFKTQLRAILRASAYGKIRIMLPMVISVDELKRSRDLLEELKSELNEKNIDYDKDIELGIMVETPASVMMSDKLIKYADFFSIGTNDLTQYMLAVDRGNENIAHLYSNYNPAVLRAIKKVIDTSHKAGKWTGMCGQFASDTNATKLLLGLGLDEFSGSASKLSKVKDTILNSSFKQAQEYASELLDLDTANEVEQKVLGDN